MFQKAAFTAFLRNVFRHRSTGIGLRLKNRMYFSWKRPALSEEVNFLTWRFLTLVKKAVHEARGMILHLDHAKRRTQILCVFKDACKT